ncbi:MAG TPA: HEAT repeat domain-containing protein [Planctomycetes bacterium]|nr:HEAT repeat domain-containing protein [Planctomycetota bacterium]HIJ70881.1 HEAT repeat domain-containing protein [Planctomycetota bacterium]
MYVKTGIIAFFGIVLVSGVGICRSIEDNWNDFLHYTAIGRFDLATGYAQNLIESNPDPVELLELSESNPNGYGILLKMYSTNKELKDLSGRILDIIEQGRFVRRTDAEVIKQEIKRLSSTIRGRLAAQERLKNAGEYAIPYLLEALADENRKDELANIADALGKIGRDAVRPLVASLQMKNTAAKVEVIRALGETGYPQSQGHLKFVAQQDPSEQLRKSALEAMEKIDPSAAKLPAAQLLFGLAEDYYYHTESLAPAADYDFANIWFWDQDSQSLVRHEVDKAYFNELMAMQNCEWALKADEDLGKAIALWLAAFFKAEATQLAMPQYFGQGHANAMTYATTAGPEYLHQALERALNEKNAYVALGIVEALAANAGEKSLLWRVGTEQPLVKALTFDDRSVRYSAAIAIGGAGPTSEFMGCKQVIENLAEAVGRKGAEELGDDLADEYAIRAVEVMNELAVRRNEVVDLLQALPDLTDATKSSWQQMQNLAGEVLARIESPDAQRAIADMALSEKNPADIRKYAFGSLAISAKLNANLLTDEQIDAIYSLISSGDTEPQIRSAAAAAYGALNLPSRRVKDLILDQAAG